MAEQKGAPVIGPAGATYTQAHTPGKRGVTLHDVLVGLVHNRRPTTEEGLIEWEDAVRAHKVGLAGSREYRLQVDAEQAVSRSGDLSGLEDEELLDRVAQGEPGAIAEFRLRRGRAQAAEAKARADRSPEQRAAEMAAKTEDELYQLALTDPDARVEMKRRHLEGQNS